MRIIEIHVVTADHVDAAAAERYAEVVARRLETWLARSKWCENVYVADVRGEDDAPATEEE